MKIDGVKRLIKQRFGSQEVFGREINVTQQMVSKMLRDDAVTQSALDALGLERMPNEYRLKVAKPARGKGKADG